MNIQRVDEDDSIFPPAERRWMLMSMTENGKGFVESSD